MANPYDQFVGGDTAVAEESNPYDQFVQPEASSKSYDTPLSSQEEEQFKSWKAANAPNDSGADYDLRGAFKAGLKPSENGHWSDQFKKPNHPTFSDQSQYAVGDDKRKAGHWDGDTFVPPDLSSIDAPMENPFAAFTGQSTLEMPKGEAEFQQPDPSSWYGAASRAALENAIPTAAGMATGTGGMLAGSGLGAALGTAIFPGVGTAIGGVLGGLVGMVGGAYAGGNVAGQVQNEIAKRVLPEEVMPVWQELRQQDAKEQEWSDFLGGFIPMAAAMKFDPRSVVRAMSTAKQLLTSPAKVSQRIAARDPDAVQDFYNLTNVVLGATLQGAPEVKRAITEEQGSWMKAALAVGLGAFFNAPNRHGRKLMFQKTVIQAQERAAEKYNRKFGNLEMPPTEGGMRPSPEGEPVDPQFQQELENIFPISPETPEQSAIGTAAESVGPATAAEISQPSTTAPSATFKTSQGSSYEWDGRTTQRNKTLHVGHDPSDVGVKDRSQATYFVTRDVAQRIADFNEEWKLDPTTPSQIGVDANGNLSLAREITGKGWKVETLPESGVSREPALDLYPVEVWGDNNTPGTWHLGSRITEVSKSSETQTKPTTGEKNEQGQNAEERQAEQQPVLDQTELGNPGAGIRQDSGGPVPDGGNGNGQVQEALNAPRTEEGGAAPEGESPPLQPVPDQGSGAGSEGSAGGEAAPVTFKTSRGSSYEWDGKTTTRTKSEHAEHPGDVGLKKQSQVTYFMTPEDAEGMSGYNSSKYKAGIVVEDGVAKLKMRHWKKDGSLGPNYDEIPVTTTPEIGLVPLELWKDTDGVFKGWHRGNEITEIQRAPVPSPESKAWTPEVKQQFEAGPAPAEGGVAPAAEPPVTGGEPSTPAMERVKSMAMKAFRNNPMATGVELVFSDAQKLSAWADPVNLNKIYVNPKVMAENVKRVRSPWKLIREAVKEEVIHDAQHKSDWDYFMNNLYTPGDTHAQASAKFWENLPAYYREIAAQIPEIDKARTIARYGQTAQGKAEGRFTLESDPGLLVKEHARQLIQRKMDGHTTEDTWLRGDQSMIVHFLQSQYEKIKARIDNGGRDLYGLQDYLKGIEGVLADAEKAGQAMAARPAQQPQAGEQPEAVTAQSQDIVPAPEPPGLEENSFPERLREDASLPKETRDAIGRPSHTVKSNQTTQMQAQEFLSRFDNPDEAFIAIQDESKPMPDGVRIASAMNLAEDLTTRINEAQSPEEIKSLVAKQVQILNWLGGNAAVSRGREVQAYAIWNKLHPESVVRTYADNVKGSQDQILGPVKETAEEVAADVNATNAEAVDKVVNRKRVKATIERVQKAGEKKNEKLRLDKEENAKKGTRTILQQISDSIGEAFSTKSSADGEKIRGALDDVKSTFSKFLNSKIEEASPTQGPDAPKKTTTDRVKDIVTNYREFKKSLDLVKQNVYGSVPEGKRGMVQSLLDLEVDSPFLSKDTRGLMKDAGLSTKNIADLPDSQLVSTARSIVNKVTEGAGYDTAFKTELTEKLTQSIKDVRDVEAGRKTQRDIDAKERAAMAIEAELKGSKSVLHRMASELGDALIDATDKKLNPAQRGILDDFNDLFKKTVKDQQKELDGPQAPKVVEKISAIDTIRDAINNFPELQKGFDLMKQRIWETGSPSEVAALQKLLDSALDIRIKKDQIAKAAREANLDIAAIARDHYTVADAAGRTLSERLVQESGLSKEQADYVAGQIEKGFKELVGESKERQIKTLIKRAEAVTPDKVRAKAEMWKAADKIIELSNLGALNQERIFNAIAEKNGLPTFSPEVAKTIREKANAIQEARAKGLEGSSLDMKVEDMLTYIAKQKGFKWGEAAWSWYYHSMLSGPTTQIANIVDSFSNLTAGIVTDALGNNPKGLVRGVATAAKALVQGAAEGAVVLKENRQNAVLRKGGAAWPSIMEAGMDNLVEGSAAKKVLKRLSDIKYVTRALTGADLMLKRAANEYRAETLAFIAAKEKGITDPVKISEFVAKELYPFAWEDAMATAKAEGLKGLTQKMRAQELIDLKRDPYMREESAKFAGIETYNQKPEGLLGVLAEGISQIAKKAPAVQIFVPFTNIVANVVNNKMDYTPWGALRVSRLGTGFPSKTETARAYRQQLAKSIMGTTALATLGVMAAMDYIDVHGSGPDDKAKRDALRSTGWRPYSIKIGDEYISYKELPIGIGLAMVANVMDAKRYGKMDDKSLDMQTLLAAGTGLKVITEMSFLKGISDFFEMFSKYGASDKALASMIARQASVPIPNAFRQLERLYDPQNYEPTTLGGLFLQNIPFARSMSGNVQINALGEPITYQPFQRFVSGSTPHKIFDMLAAKEVTIPQLGKAGKIGARKMTPDEQYDVYKTRGEFIKKMLSDKFVEEAIRNAATKEEAQAIVDAVANAGTAAAKEELMKKVDPKTLSTVPEGAEEVEE